MEQYSVKAVLSAVDKNFNSTLSRANSSISRISESSKSALSSIRNIAGGLGVFSVVSKATDMLTNSIDGAIDRYDTLNKYPKVLKNIGYSTEQANDSTKKLKEGIQGLPTALDEVTGVAQRITILTGNLEKGTNTALALNNALLASSASTSDVTRGMEQYIQMLSKGEVDMQSWRTLQETMSYALSVTAKELGIASGNSLELYDALYNGKITFDQFNDALIKCSTRTGGFAEMALTASAGIKTSFTNIQTALKSGVEGTIAAIDTMLENSGLPKIQEMLDSIKATIGQIFGSYTVLDDGTKQFNSGLMQAVGNFDQLNKVATQFGVILGGVFTIAGSFDYIDMAGKSFERATKKVTGLRTGIGDLKKYIKQANIDGQLKKIAQESDTTMKKLKSGIARAAKAYEEKGMSMAEAFEKAYDDIGVSTEMSLKSLTSKFSSVTDSIGNRLKNLVPSSVKSKITGFGNILSSTMALGQNKINSVGDAIGRLSFKFGAMTGRFNADTPKIWKVFDGISTKIRGILPSFDALASGITSGLKKSASAGVKSMSWMTKAMSSVFKLALKTVGPGAIIGVIVAGMGIAEQQFGKQIDKMLDTVSKKGPEIIKSFAKGITHKVPYLAKSGSEMVGRILKTISRLIPDVVSAGISIIRAFTEGLTQNIEHVIYGAREIVFSICNAVIEALPQIMLIGLDILLALVQGILNNSVIITDGINTMIENIKTAITTYLPQMIEKGCEILMGIAQGIVMALPQIIIGAIEIITTLVDTIGDSNNLKKIVDAAAQIINTLVSGIIENLPEILTAAVELLGSLAGALINVENLKVILSAGLDIVKNLAQSLKDAVGELVDAAGKLIEDFVDKFLSYDWAGLGAQIIKGIVGGLNLSGAIENAAKNITGKIKGSVAKGLGIHSPSKWGIWIGKMTDTGIGKGLAKYTSMITSGADKAVSRVKSSFENIRNTVMPEFSFAGMSNDLNIHYAVDLNDEEIRRAGAEISEKNEYTFNAALNVDGKEFAHSTAKYTDEELKKQEKLKNMIKGVK